MTNDDLFCDAQHGFVPGRSYMTQLLVTLERRTELLGGGDPVVIIYLDSREVFDTVPHWRLIKFVIFINDLPDDVTCTANIFSDDTKLFRGISSYGDCLQFQDYLNRLLDWSQKWQMGFNEPKCNVFHLSSTNPCYEYPMRNTSLEAITEKDLGVTIKRDLKFHYGTPSFGILKCDLCPRFRRDKLEVGQIQRRATQLIPNLINLPYIDRLEALRLPPLCYRR